MTSKNKYQVHLYHCQTRFQGFFGQGEGSLLVNITMFCDLTRDEICMPLVIYEGKQVANFSKNSRIKQDMKKIVHGYYYSFQKFCLF